MSRVAVHPNSKVMGGTRRKRIYVADDEVTISRTIALILAKSGYDATPCEDADCILRAMRYDPADLVIADVIMPGSMNGIELYETIAMEFPGVPVILFSGQAETSELIAAARERGTVVDVLPKPIAPDALLQRIAELLNQPA